jgi:hypothetical protein
VLEAFVGTPWPRVDDRAVPLEDMRALRFLAIR